MNILIVGGGGREHAVVQAIKKNPKVEQIYALPGNGGIADDAECFPIKATDLDAIEEFAKSHAIGFAAITQDDPLVLGCVDRLEALGIPCFGPTADAAIIEGSKVFSKELMKKYGIPTAESETFTDAEKAIAYLKNTDYPTVIKADGLAAGKGAVIVNNFDEAEKTVRKIMVDRVFGASGNRILVEEFLTGPEVSVLSFTDGKTIIPMVSSMDHKRAHDNDEGPNTGGMGTVAPNPYYTEEIAEECMERIFLPTVEAMNKEGRTFKGCIFFGLMLTPKGPKVIEYNCRFGDPETQAVLPLLETDLFEIMLAVRQGRLNSDMVRFKEGAACCVIVASSGYPEKYATGYEIALPETKEGEYLYVAGAKRDGGRLLTSGGRVVGASSVGRDLKEAIAGAYALAEKIKFENAYMRKDIGAHAMKALQEE